MTAREQRRRRRKEEAESAKSFITVPPSSFPCFTYTGREQCALRESEISYFPRQLVCLCCQVSPSLWTEGTRREIERRRRGFESHEGRRRRMEEEEDGKAWCHGSRSAQNSRLGFIEERREMCLIFLLFCRPLMSFRCCKEWSLYFLLSQTHIHT